jgi:polyphosphate kinase
MAKKKQKKDKQKQHHPEVRAPLAVERQAAGAGPPPKMKRKEYEREMRVLHGELVALQEWVKAPGPRSASCSRAGTPPGRAARSSGSPSG